MWRACLDILPTRTKLFDRGVLHSFSCHWCEDATKTSSHVLWQCEFVQRIWRACPISIPNVCGMDMTFCDLISHCILVLSHPNIEILFTTAWEIWNARNQHLWENKIPIVDDIWKRVAGWQPIFWMLDCKSVRMVGISQLQILVDGDLLKWEITS
jgi:hypothetical protein